MDLSLKIVYWILNFFRNIKNILLEGTLSQTFYWGLSFNLSEKTGNF